MPRINQRLGALAAASLLLCCGAQAAAALIRFHYVPVDACGNTTLQPTGPCGAVGERVRWFGSVREAYVNQPRPTHLVSFRHPYTGRPIVIPFALPEGTPRLEHLPARVVYNYGSYTVEARFLADGSVDVVYDAGLLRSP